MLCWNPCTCHMKSILNQLCTSKNVILTSKPFLHEHRNSPELSGTSLLNLRTVRRNLPRLPEQPTQAPELSENFRNLILRTGTHRGLSGLETPSEIRRWGMKFKWMNSQFFLVVIFCYLNMFLVFFDIFVFFWNDFLIFSCLYSITLFIIFIVNFFNSEYIFLILGYVCKDISPNSSGGEWNAQFFQETDVVPSWFSGSR